MGTRNKTVLLDKPQKKARVKERHKRVAEEFKEWLKKNPKANHKETFSVFDMYCDSALLEEKINSDA